MDINQMRYFLEICNTQSISKAAENVFLTQQGLSSSMRRLEAECGCNLFFRKGGKLILTDAGSRFKADAEAIIKKIDQLLLYFKENSVVSVVCTLNLIVRMPIKLQRAFINGKSEDGIPISFSEDWTLDAEETVYDGGCNFGIVYGECDERRFDVVTLDSFEQVFIVNRASEMAKLDSISIKELSGKPMIIPNEKCRPGVELRRFFKDAGAELNIAAQFGDRPRQTIDMVSANSALVARIIVNDLTEDDMDSIKPLTPRDIDFSYPVCLISKKGRQLSESEKLFKYFVIDCYKNK